jgi:hypothetical protein
MRFLFLLQIGLAFLLYIGCGPAIAQLSSGAPVVISLQTELLNLSVPGVYVEQVIDARASAGPLGLVVRGLNSTLREVELQQGLVPELAGLLHNRLPTGGTRPVVLRILSVGVAEAPIGNFRVQMAAELSAEWYARQPDSTYYLLCRTSRTTQRISSAEPKNSHMANLGALLEASLQQMAGVDWAAQQAANPRYEAAALRRRLPTQTYPIQSEERLRPGVYNNFFEFRYNAPGRPGNVQADARAYQTAEWQGLRAVSPFMLTPEGQHVAVEQAWGFCDGQQLYIRFGADYFLLEKRGTAFLFFAPALYNNNNTLLFNGGPPKHAYSLNLFSGLTTNYAGPSGLISLNKEGLVTHLMVYRRRQKNAPPLPVQLNDQAAGELREGDYLSLPWHDGNQPVRLCVGTEACLELTPSFSEANYIEYQPGAPASLQLVPVREGKTQVTRMAGR